MKITRIETLRLGEFPNLLWVHVHTDAGITGLGETFYGAGAVEQVMHETVAPLMLGQNPLAIEKHSRKLLQNYVGYKSSGAETRASGSGRTEYAEHVVRSFAFWL
jgi:L-alanine-DL-glutamate epimerase-like enolase superfamily enzyme